MHHDAILDRAAVAKAFQPRWRAGAAARRIHDKIGGQHAPFAAVPVDGPDAGDTAAVWRRRQRDGVVIVEQRDVSDGADTPPDVVFQALSQGQG